MSKKLLNALLPVTASALVCAISLPTIAAPINYGNFSGANVNFLQVTEDSATDPTPLFGPPTVAGDGMTFSPTAAFSANASSGSIDLTDGKLNTTIQANTPATTIGFAQNFMLVFLSEPQVVRAAKARASTCPRAGRSQILGLAFTMTRRL